MTTENWKVHPWAWWPEAAVARLVEELWPKSYEAAKACADCGQTVVSGKQRFCEKCGYERRKKANNAARRQNRV